MKIFLTGGTGFIGSHLAMALLAEGHELTILARDIGKVPALAKARGVELAGGDLSDRALLESLVAGKDAVIHVALKYDEKRPGWQVLMDDTLPTVFLAEAAAGAGVGRFIYTSSTACNDSVYSGPPEYRDRIKLATTATKQRPATFYGATKAASENFLMALAHLSKMKINIVRPGYAFGNPAIEGGSIEGDIRFRNIARVAARGEEIGLVKNDGTQFIFAGDLAKLYVALLGSDGSRRTYYGLSKAFIAWQDVALETVKRSGSRSSIKIEDLGWKKKGTMWDVSDMKRDFGLEFDAWPEIGKHIDFLLAEEKTKG